MEESNPRVLAFEKGELDYLDVPTDLVPNVMEPNNTLKPRFAKAGVMLERGVQPSITYTYFNMEDPVVGGYTNDKIALRRAIGMGYNVDEEIRVVRQGQGLFATQIVPPPVSGYDPNFLANTKYDPAGAKALLDKFGYIDRDKDGWRDMPDGKPLVLKRGTSPSALERQYDELWQRNMTAIGIRMEMVTQRWPDLLKMARNGQLQMWQLANTSSTTEGYGFLGLLYGPNAGLANLSRFKQPEFDRLYDESKKLPDGPQRAEDGQGNVADRRRVRAVEDQRVPDRERRRVSVGRSATNTIRSTSTRGNISTSISRCRERPSNDAHAAGAAVHRVRARRAGAGSPRSGPIRPRCCASRSSIAETGFDPQAAQDLYSNTINSAIFDPLYEYDYLARPHRIVPRTADALPEISADGLTWKIRVRKASTSPTTRRSRA